MKTRFDLISLTLGVAVLFLTASACRVAQNEAEAAKRVDSLSQASKIEAEQSGKKIEWPTPDVSSWRLVSRDRKELSSLGTTIVLHYEAKPATPEYVISASRGTDGDVEAWSIGTIFEYRISERPICYNMRGSKVSLDGSGKVRSRIATRVGLQLCDIDGDGRFERLAFIDPLAETPPISEP